MSSVTGVQIAPLILLVLTPCIRSSPSAMATSPLATVPSKLLFPKTIHKSRTTWWKFHQSTDATTLPAQRQVSAMPHAGMQRAAEGQNATSPPHIISGMKLHSKLKTLHLLTYAVDSSVLMMIFANMDVPMRLNAITTSLTVTILTWSKYMMRKLRRRLWFRLWIDASLLLVRASTSALMATIATMEHV